MEYRQAAKERLKRLKGRNCLISQDTKEGISSCKTKSYIEQYCVDTLANIDYNLLSVPLVIPEIPSEFIPHRHTDKWLLYESGYADFVYDWFLQTIKLKPNTYTITGVVRDSKDKPVGGIVVESGRTHYAITNEDGEYSLEGLISGIRRVYIVKEGSDSITISQDVHLKSNIGGLDFILSEE